MKDSSIGSPTEQAPVSSTELLLKRDFTVYSIEPNREMRKAAENLLAHYTKFRRVNGSDEETGLEDRSVDFISVATAFHWMEPMARY